MTACLLRELPGAAPEIPHHPASARGHLPVLPAGEKQRDVLGTGWHPNAGLMPTTGQRLCGCRRGPNVEQGKWYGVRSYLHLFYEDCTGASPGDDFSKAPACSRWTSVLWKVTLSTGTLLLLMGAAALATGYLLPPKLEGIGEEEFLVLDQQAVEYNHALGICRAVGTVLCAMAGALLVSCVLCSGLCRGGQWGEEGLDKEEQERPPPGQQRGTIVTAAPAPFRPLCVQSVQPKRET